MKVLIIINSLVYLYYYIHQHSNGAGAVIITSVLTHLKLGGSVPLFLDAL